MKHDYDWKAHEQDVATARETYANEPMSRQRAYDVAMAWGLRHKLPIQPKPHGLGYDAVIPMEVIELALENCGDLPKRTRHKAEEPEPVPYGD